MDQFSLLNSYIKEHKLNLAKYNLDLINFPDLTLSFHELQDKVDDFIKSGSYYSQVPKITESYPTPEARFMGWYNRLASKVPHLYDKVGVDEITNILKSKKSWNLTRNQILKFEQQGMINLHLVKNASHFIPQHDQQSSVKSLSTWESYLVGLSGTYDQDLVEKTKNFYQRLQKEDSWATYVLKSSLIGLSDFLLLKDFEWSPSPSNHHPYQHFHQERVGRSAAIIGTIEFLSPLTKVGSISRVNKIGQRFNTAVTKGITFIENTPYLRNFYTFILDYFVQNKRLATSLLDSYFRTQTIQYGDKNSKEKSSITNSLPSLGLTVFDYLVEKLTNNYNHLVPESMQSMSLVPSSIFWEDVINLDKNSKINFLISNAVKENEKSLNQGSVDFLRHCLELHDSVEDHNFKDLANSRFPQKPDVSLSIKMKRKDDYGKVSLFDKKFIDVHFDFAVGAKYTLSNKNNLIRSYEKLTDEQKEFIGEYVGTKDSTFSLSHITGDPTIQLAEEGTAYELNNEESFPNTITLQDSASSDKISFTVYQSTDKYSSEKKYLCSNQFVDYHVPSGSWRLKENLKNFYDKHLQTQEKCKNFLTANLNVESDENNRARFLIQVLKTIADNVDIFHSNWGDYLNIYFKIPNEYSDTELNKYTNQYLLDIYQADKALLTKRDYTNPAKLFETLINISTSTFKPTIKKIRNEIKHVIDGNLALESSESASEEDRAISSAQLHRFSRSIRLWRTIKDTFTDSVKAYKRKHSPEDGPELDLSDVYMDEDKKLLIDSVDLTFDQIQLLHSLNTTAFKNDSDSNELDDIEALTHNVFKKNLEMRNFIVDNFCLGEKTALSKLQTDHQTHRSDRIKENAPLSIIYAKGLSELNSVNASDLEKYVKVAGYTMEYKEIKDFIGFCFTKSSSTDLPEERSKQFEHLKNLRLKLGGKNLKDIPYVTTLNRGKPSHCSVDFLNTVQDIGNKYSSDGVANLYTDVKLLKDTVIEPNIGFYKKQHEKPLNNYEDYKALWDNISDKGKTEGAIHTKEQWDDTVNKATTNMDLLEYIISANRFQKSYDEYQTSIDNFKKFIGDGSSLKIDNLTDRYEELNRGSADGEAKKDKELLKNISDFHVSLNASENKYDKAITEGNVFMVVYPKDYHSKDISSDNPLKIYRYERSPTWTAKDLEESKLPSIKEHSITEKPPKLTNSRGDMDVLLMDKDTHFITTEPHFNGFDTGQHRYFEKSKNKYDINRLKYGKQFDDTFGQWFGMSEKKKIDLVADSDLIKRDPAVNTENKSLVSENKKVIKYIEDGKGWLYEFPTDPNEAKKDCFQDNVLTIIKGKEKRNRLSRQPGKNILERERLKGKHRNLNVTFSKKGKIILETFFPKTNRKIQDYSNRGNRNKFLDKVKINYAGQMSAEGLDKIFKDIQSAIVLKELTKDDTDIFEKSIKMGGQLHIPNGRFKAKTKVYKAIYNKINTVNAPKNYLIDAVNSYYKNDEELLKQPPAKIQQAIMGYMLIGISGDITKFRDHTDRFDVATGTITNSSPFERIMKVLMNKPSAEIVNQLFSTDTHDPKANPQAQAGVINGVARDLEARIRKAYTQYSKLDQFFNEKIITQEKEEKKEPNLKDILELKVKSKKVLDAISSEGLISKKDQETDINYANRLVKFCDEVLALERTHSVDGVTKGSLDFYHANVLELVKARSPNFVDEQIKLINKKIEEKKASSAIVKAMAAFPQQSYIKKIAEEAVVAGVIASLSPLKRAAEVFSIAHNLTTITSQTFGEKEDFIHEINSSENLDKCIEKLNGYDYYKKYQTHPSKKVTKDLILGGPLDKAREESIWANTVKDSSKVELPLFEEHVSVYNHERFLDTNIEKTGLHIRQQFDKGWKLQHILNNFRKQVEENIAARKSPEAYLLRELYVAFNLATKISESEKDKKSIFKSYDDDFMTTIYELEGKFYRVNEKHKFTSDPKIQKQQEKWDDKQEAFIRYNTKEEAIEDLKKNIFSKFYELDSHRENVKNKLSNLKAKATKLLNSKDFEQIPNDLTTRIAMGQLKNEKTQEIEDLLDKVLTTQMAANQIRNANTQEIEGLLDKVDNDIDQFTNTNNTILSHVPSLYLKSNADSKMIAEKYYLSKMLNAFMPVEETKTVEETETSKNYKLDNVASVKLFDQGEIDFMNSIIKVQRSTRDNKDSDINSVYDDKWTYTLQDDKTIEVFEVHIPQDDKVIEVFENADNKAKLLKILKKSQLYQKNNVSMFTANFVKDESEENAKYRMAMEEADQLFNRIYKKDISRKDFDKDCYFVPQASTRSGEKGLDKVVHDLTILENAAQIHLMAKDKEPNFTSEMNAMTEPGNAMFNSNLTTDQIKKAKAKTIDSLRPIADQGYNEILKIVEEVTKDNYDLIDAKGKDDYDALLSAEGEADEADNLWNNLRAGSLMEQSVDKTKIKRDRTKIAEQLYNNTFTRIKTMQVNASASTFFSYNLGNGNAIRYQLGLDFDIHNGSHNPFDINLKINSKIMIDFDFPNQFADLVSKTFF